MNNLIYGKVIYSIAVMIMTVFLVHYLSWTGLFGLLALNIDFMRNDKN